jgi:alanine dehydrogenase
VPAGASHLYPGSRYGSRLTSDQGDDMQQRTIGVVGASRKDGDLRRPIHPRHLTRIDDDLRDSLTFEYGYGEHFGVGDDEIAGAGVRVASRGELIERCDVVLLPKPVHADVAELRDGQTLWGWPHCVQDPVITQMAIDHKLTLIAWEAMNHWNADGSFALHVFHKNNEIAGYASVLHALSVVGRTGHYGPRVKAAVISFGATARGAVTALQGLGVFDVTVLTQRDTTAVAAPTAGVLFGQFERTEEDPSLTVALRRSGPQPTAQFLAEHDIIVNCVLQDVEAPLMFVRNQDLDLFDAGALFIDVSCDEGMGFEFARPTSFPDPMFEVGNGAHYYGVDHSPSYLWNAATWEISEALLPYLRVVIEGPEVWDADETIRRAIEIRDGVVQNPAILSFQGRAEQYPHPQDASAVQPGQ